MPNPPTHPACRACFGFLKSWLLNRTHVQQVYEYKYVGHLDMAAEVVTLQQIIKIKSMINFYKWCSLLKDSCTAHPHHLVHVPKLDFLTANQTQENGPDARLRCVILRWNLSQNYIVKKSCHAFGFVWSNSFWHHWCFIGLQSVSHHNSDVFQVCLPL